MGESLRIFIILDDDQLSLMPLTRYERLRRGDPEVRFPEFAGKKVRFAVALINLENRELSSIWRIDYEILHFDAAGRLDSQKKWECLQLAIGVLGNFTRDILNAPPPEHRGKVIHAKNKFLRKQFTWKASRSLEDKIVAAIYKLYERPRRIDD
ncbi:MAG: hypothetical protein ACYDIC_15620 [Desulfobaccales bacterium]